MLIQTAVDSTGPVVGNILPATGAGALLYALWQIWGPVLSTKLFAKWNEAKGRMDGMSNGLKATLYVLLTWALLFVPKLVGYTFDPDPNNWTAGAFLDFLTAVAGTIFSHINVQMTKQKMARAPAVR